VEQARYAAQGHLLPVHSRLPPPFTDQSQHLVTPLKARPPNRAFSGGIALQVKRGIVREQRTHRFDAAAVKHRPVRPMKRAGRNGNRQRRGAGFGFNGRVSPVREQQIDNDRIGIAGGEQQRVRRVLAAGAIRIRAMERCVITLAAAIDIG
jgi:hypothetical protein